MAEARDVTTIRRGREFWERAVRELERGASVSEVARRLGVKPATLSWWRWQLRSEGTKAEPGRRREREAGAEFLPVVVAPSVEIGRAGLVEIDVGSARVRVEVGVDVNYVSALVRALGSAC